MALINNLSKANPLASKKKLAQEKKKFDLKFLLVGNPGSGKTHLTASYTKGPLHYYMFDHNGRRTLEKVTKNRNDVTLDDFSSSKLQFSDFWKQFQEDEKAGLFDYLAENQGLLIPDSLTNINRKAIDEIARKAGVTPSGIGQRIDMKKGMAPPHWGQLLNWMTTFVTAVQELPCAVAVPVHLHVLMNSDQEVVARYPSVNGQFRQLLGSDFDEVYLLVTQGSKRQIFFTEKLSFEAKSGVFDMPKVEGITMDDLVTAYLAGKTVIPNKIN